MIIKTRGVIFEYLPTLWDVNPITLEKRLSKDDYPPYIQKNKNTELTLNSVFSIYTKDSIVLCNTTQRVCPTEIYIL